MEDLTKHQNDSSDFIYAKIKYTVMYFNNALQCQAMPSRWRSHPPLERQFFFFKRKETPTTPTTVKVFRQDSLKLY